MACALPVLGQNESDGIPDYLHCPICAELPEKVFQCKAGHTLCGTCYKNLTDCPQCRSRFDKADPIRSRFFEDLLDKFVKVDCAYKRNGCIEQPTRELVHLHQTKCLFNIDKFGEMVNLCKLIDYKACDFRFNLGNIEDAVQHFVLAHSCVLTGSGPFQMKLTGFQESTEANPSSNCFCTPVISDLKERNCFLLTCAKLNVSSTTGSLTCLSLMMPKSHDVSETLTMEYCVASASDRDCHLDLRFFQKSILLKNVDSLLPNNLPCSFQIINMGSHFTEDGSLLVNCNVREGGTNSSSQTDKKVKKFEKIVCPKTTVSDVISPACNQDQGHDSGGCGSMDSKREEIIEIANLTARDIENGIIVDATEPTPGYLLQHAKILVENLPDFATKKHVKNVFTQFGEVESIQKLKQNPNGTYLFCKSKSKTIGDACLVDFARKGFSSVYSFRKSKWRPFIKKDEKRHYFNAKILLFYTSAPDNWKEKKGLDFWQDIDYMLSDPEQGERNGFELDRNGVSKLIEEDYPTYTSGCKYFEQVCGLLFCIAAEYGTLDCVKYCIEKGMDINAIRMRNDTNSVMNVLARTLFDKDEEIGLEKTKLLVESGADIHFKDKFGRSLLHMSVLWGCNENAVKFFLEKGLNVNEVDKAGETPLHSALLFGSEVQLLLEKVELLLDHGASLNTKDKRGQLTLNLVRVAPVEYRGLIDEMFKKHLNK